MKFKFIANTVAFVKKIFHMVVAWAKTKKTSELLKITVTGTGLVAKIVRFIQNRLRSIRYKKSNDRTPMQNAASGVYASENEKKLSKMIQAELDKEAQIGVSGSDKVYSKKDKKKADKFFKKIKKMKNLGMSNSEINDEFRRMNEIQNAGGRKHKLPEAFRKNRRLTEKEAFELWAAGKLSGWDLPASHISAA